MTGHDPNFRNFGRTFCYRRLLTNKSPMKSLSFTTLIMLLNITLFGQEFTKADIVRHRIKSVSFVDENGLVKRIHQYNEHGDLISAGQHTSGGLMKSKELIYNDYKLLTEEKNFNPLGNVHFTHRFSYNAKKQLIRKESIDSDNRIQTTWTYEYDNEGNLVKESVASTLEGNNVTRYKYHKGKLVEEETTNDVLGKEEKVTFSYNEKGQLTEQKIKSYFTNSTTTISFTYNSHGRLTRQVERSDNGADGETHYTYDENGLLSRQTVRSLADSLTEITNYQIERY